MKNKLKTKKKAAEENTCSAMRSYPASRMTQRLCAQRVQANGFELIA